MKVLLNLFASNLDSVALFALTFELPEGIITAVLCYTA